MHAPRPILEPTVQYVGIHTRLQGYGGNRCARLLTADNQFAPDRKGEHPQQHLRRYQGILQEDAYGSWGELYGSGQITGGACWAGARRPHQPH